MIIRFFLLAVVLMTTTLSYGQKDEIYENIEDSFDFAKASLANIEDYYSYLRKSKNETFEDSKFYIRRAKYSIDDSKNNANSAKSASDDAESEANDLNCDDVESECDDAEAEFNNAYSNLDYAYTYLRRAENADDLDTLTLNLKRAKSSVEDAINNLNAGMSNLNDAVEELNDCK